ncbi:hypothetical protein FI667_g4610, partial [Globisporangium splendens]
MKQVPKEQQQQRPLSTRALPKKPLFNTGLHTQSSHRATTLSNPQTFAEWGEDYMQQPQQAEAAKPSPSQFFSTSRKAMSASSSTMEMENVRSENETLRLGIANLKEKLVEKMRGGGKIVAGGQFRGNSCRAAKPAQSPPSASTNSFCNSRSSMRLTLKKSRNECAQSQQVTEELHQEIAKMEAIQYTLWGENSAHVSEIKELRGKLDQMERCRALTDSRVQVLEQQSPIEAQNLGNHDPELSDNNVVSREMADSATQCSPRESNRAEEIQYGYLQDEVKRLRLELTACEQDKKTVSECWLYERNSLEQQRGEYAEYHKKHTRCHEDNEHRLASLAQMLESRRQDLASLQESHAAETVQNTEHREVIVQLRKALERQDARTCQLEKENQEVVQANETLQTQVARLESQSTAHSRESIRLLSRLKDLEATNSVLSTENAQLHTAIQRHIKEIDEQNQSLRESKVKVNELEIELGILKQNDDLIETVDKTEISRLQQLLATSRDEIAQMKVQIDAMESESARDEDFIIKLKHSHAKALEDALHSTVRLCVVAPTVNVHLSDAMSISNKPDPVTCRTRPPQDRIRETV